jgi:hypothetical protein
MKPKFPIGALLRYKYADGTKPETSHVMCKVAGYAQNWNYEECYEIAWYNRTIITLSDLQGMWWMEKNYLDVSSKLARLFYL